jgi:uncharacterized protein YbjT (DUF2867 family)
MQRKFVVIGGSGLIGRQVVASLARLGHDVTAASPSTGVNTITGEGLATAFAGAQVVVDVSNAPSFEAAAALEFFETAGRNILAAEKAAGVSHHVALSVVGTDRLADNNYFRAKLAQEKLIKAGGIPYSIVRATQFFEFIGAIVESAADGPKIHLSAAAFQPVAAKDVAAAVSDAALGEPLNGIVEIGGPERRPLVDFARDFMRSTGDQRQTIADTRAPYFGTVLDDSSLTPSKTPRIGETRFAEWLVLLRRREAPAAPTPGASERQ